MTNEEAIKELREMYKEIDDIFVFTVDKKFEALDFAIKALEERPHGDLISREDLKEEFKKRCHAAETVDELSDAVDDLEDLIDNATTVCGNNPKWCESCVSKGKCASTRPQGDCEKCDFRKFAETFIDAIVEVMNKYGITSLEQLSEMLKGGTE